MTAFAKSWLAHYARRDKLFGVLTEAQWRVLLDLRAQGRPLSVTSCCIASDAPMSTALRHIGELVDGRMIVRSRHPDDGRSELLSLSDDAVALFEQIEEGA